MAVKIRLRRIGKLAKKRMYFRIAVIDERKSRDGSIIEDIGHYDPTKKPADFKVNFEKVDYWKSKGAQLSPTVASLIKKGRKNAATS